MRNHRAAFVAEILGPENSAISGLSRKPIPTRILGSPWFDPALRCTAIPTLKTNDVVSGLRPTALGS
jgi:hypothetical protein